MTFRSQIEKFFEGKAFDRPLFYAHKGGLRFELSKGGSYLNQFLTALRKGSEICDSIFDEQVTVCIKIYGAQSLLSSLSVFREFKDLGVIIPECREHWSENDEDDEDFEGSETNKWHYIAFNADKVLLEHLLWCSFAAHFGSIKPRPKAMVYLFNFKKQLMVWPYDDRGMDVVGNNHKLLKDLYLKFNAYLLGNDREAMDVIYANTLQ